MSSIEPYLSRSCRPRRPALLTLFSLACLVLAAVLSLPLAIPAGAAPLSTSGSIYFSQTNHTASNGFLSFWLAHGQAVRWGYPITDEFQENGTTVQYFERGRLEYHANAPANARITASLTGSMLAGSRRFQPGSAIRPTSYETYFPQTQHTLRGSFYNYWKSHGQLESFGYPLSEEFAEGGHTVQYFQRARFELTRDGGIWLGHIGRELLDLHNVEAAATAAARPGFEMSFNGGSTWFPGNWQRIISLNQIWGNLPNGYKGYGLYAAMPADLNLYGRWGRVTRGDKNIWVQFVDVIDWKDINQVRGDGKVIDLGTESFQQFAPLSAGVIRVTVDVAWPGFQPEFAR
jgi:hypothetical protein